MVSTEIYLRIQTYFRNPFHFENILLEEPLTHNSQVAFSPAPKPRITLQLLVDIQAFENFLNLGIFLNSFLTQHMIKAASKWSGFIYL